MKVIAKTLIKNNKSIGKLWRRHYRRVRFQGQRYKKNTHFPKSHSPEEQNISGRYALKISATA